MTQPVNIIQQKQLLSLSSGTEAQKNIRCGKCAHSTKAQLGIRITLEFNLFCITAPTQWVVMIVSLSLRLFVCLFIFYMRLPHSSASS